MNDDDIARAITQTLGRSVKGLWPVTLPSSPSDEAGLVNLYIDHERPWFTVPIKELVLATLYSTVTVDGQARVVPQFQRRLGTEIQLKLTWKTPSTMRLRGLLRGTPLHFDRPAIDLMWLLAYTSDSQIWKLPLPNVYADCKVCTGNGAVGGDSYRDAVWRIHETVLRRTVEHRLMGLPRENTFHVQLESCGRRQIRTNAG